MTSKNKTFLDAADRIGKKICKAAFWSNSRCNWIGRTLDDPTSTDYETPLSRVVANKALEPHLYDGVSGVALFLGYLYFYTRQEKYRQVAEGGIRCALTRLKETLQNSRLGFYSGNIGIAFVTAKLGIIFNDEYFKQTGLELLKDIAQQENEDEHFMDIMSGNAGAILALLNIYDTFQEEQLLDFATRLGNSLLSVAVNDVGGSLSWNSKANGVQKAQHNLTGFSHGAAGIGYSLLYLFNKTDKKEYLIAANKAFAYENHWFNKQHNNWPDFRIATETQEEEETVVGHNTESSFKYSVAWCHGAPGIGLSRLFAYNLIKDETYLQDCYTSLRTIKKIVNNIPRDYDFSLCHGLSGICEPLIIAANILKDDSYKAIADKVGFYGINRYLKKDNVWPCGISSGETPSLMLGLSGIGYFYLRLFDPKGIPSVLTVI